MNTIYEFIISDKVSFEQVAMIVSNYTNISYEKIEVYDEYFNKLGTASELKIGIDIFFYSKGYKTYIEVNHICFTLKDFQIIELACKLAIGLKSNVAVGDFTDSKEFTYVIISPDEKYQKAYNSITREGNDGEQVMEFTTYTEKADLSEYISVVK